MEVTFATCWRTGPRPCSGGGASCRHDHANIMDACNPYSTTNILEIHGTEDDVTYYDGDPTNQDGWGAYPSIPETMDFFVDLFGLVNEGTEELPNTDATDGSEVEITAWSNETACPRLELYKVIGGGHDWPGAWGNMDIDASLVAWEFFESTCNSTLPLSIEPARPSAETTARHVGHAGASLSSHAAGQLVIERLSNGQVRKVPGCGVTVCCRHNVICMRMSARSYTQSSGTGTGLKPYVS